MRRLAIAFAALALAFTAHAAPPKVLRIAQQTIGGDALDPAQLSSILVANVIENIMEPMLRYDYLARPLKLVPNTLESLPEASEGGRVYTCRLKRGVMFAPDPAFRGKPRELVAADYAYGIRRLFDPRWKSTQYFLVDGKIAGANALRKAALAGKPFDYDKPIAGLEVVDRYTLRITLTAPDLNFLHILAQQNLAAVAREAVELYGDDIGQHPVGTGPFMQVERHVGSGLVLARNPGYREEMFEGRKLPSLDRVELIYTVEDQPMWLAFLGHELDMLINVPVSFRLMAAPNGKLAPHLARQGVQLHTYVYPAIWFDTFNMRDPVVGGYTPEKIALRRAISMAYPIQDEIAIIYKNQAVELHTPIAPGMAGYTPERSPTLEYNPAKAKALLDMYGYLDRDGDGWREMPDGSPLVIDQASTPEQRARQRNQLWSRAMSDIGVRMTFGKVEKLPDLRRQAQLGRVQMFTYGWIADYPDGENFLQLFLTRSIGGANYTLFSNAEFDALYERVKTMPDSPERTALYRRMVHILWVYGPWRVNSLLRNTILIQPWVIGFKKHPFAHDPWRYLDVDSAKLPRS
jgi:ABC-type transport system substrate-binding protein